MTQIKRAPCSCSMPGSAVTFCPGPKYLASGLTSSGTSCLFLANAHPPAACPVVSLVGRRASSCCPWQTRYLYRRPLANPEPVRFRSASVLPPEFLRPDAGPPAIECGLVVVFRLETDPYCAGKTLSTQSSLLRQLTARCAPIAGSSFGRWFRIFGMVCIAAPAMDSVAQRNH